MAHHKSAKKRIQLSAVQNTRNRINRSRLNTALKNVLETQDKENIENDYRKAVSLIDKLTAKGLIHLNNAARKKSRLAHHVKAVLN